MVDPVVATHAAPAHTVQAAPPAEPLAAVSCGGGDSEGCCGGHGEGSCGQGSCAGDGHATSCAGETPDRLPQASATGATSTTSTTSATQSDDSAAALTRIQDPSQVCMVRNHFMGRPQLAVEADGSTYYGCCAGCANRLLQDTRARTAIDPLSHNPVDKGLAVLARTTRGAVLYFENESNLEMFRATLQ